MRSRPKEQHRSLLCGPLPAYNLFPAVTAICALIVFVGAWRLPYAQYSNASQHMQSTSAASLPPWNRLPSRNDWTLSTSPSICKVLLANPTPLKAGCGERDENGFCSSGEAMMFSEHQQDWYLYTRHFSRLRRPGVYLDVAANVAVRISNTYFMDACLGWRGLCVEANQRYHEKIRSKRSCALLPSCVGDTDGMKVTFSDAKTQGGIVETNNNFLGWKILGHWYGTIQLTCTTLAPALETYEITEVDYMSLDVEGHELPVLRGIPWNQTRINVMTIESKGDSLHQIEQFLKPKGYVRHVVEPNEVTGRNGKLYRDSVFIHRDVVFGQPE